MTANIIAARRTIVRFSPKLMAAGVIAVAAVIHGEAVSLEGGDDEEDSDEDSEDDVEAANAVEESAVPSSPEPPRSVSTAKPYP